MTIEERLEQIERQLISLSSKLGALLPPTGALRSKKEYLTKNEVAEKLGVSVATIDRWIEAHKIPYIKIGGTIRFKIDHLEKFLANHERKSRRIIA